MEVLRYAKVWQYFCIWVADYAKGSLYNANQQYNDPISKARPQVSAACVLLESILRFYLMYGFTPGSDGSLRRTCVGKGAELLDLDVAGSDAPLAPLPTEILTIFTCFGTCAGASCTVMPKERC